jgi:hypothetical protein
MPFEELPARFAAPEPKPSRALILVDDTEELPHHPFDPLATRGLPGVYTLQGGMKAWRQANRPISK